MATECRDFKATDWYNILSYDDYQLGELYKEWGMYFTKLQNLDKAAIYYNAALELNANDAQSAYNRSKLNREKIDIKQSLKDAELAKKLEDRSAPIDLQYCDMLFESNNFEKSLNELGSNSQKYCKHKQKIFNERANVIERTISHCLGNSCLKFAVQNLDTLYKVKYTKKEEDSELLFKKLKAEQECDVVSILDEKAKILRPIDVEKTELNLKRYVSIYLGKSAKDVLFLRSLSKHKDFAVPHTIKTSKIISETANQKYHDIKVILGMLHARCPLYEVNEISCPSRKLRKEKLEAHLYGIQYQTRRTMHQVLVKMKQLRESGDLAKLTKSIELFMGKYITIKTSKILPLKFQFINELCHVYALANVDKLIIPETIDDVSVMDKVSTLLGLQLDKDVTGIQYVFGDKSTYQNPDEIDYKYIRYKKYVIGLETRVQQTKFSIEKCYLYHQISMEHLKYEKFKESFAYSKKLYREAGRANNRHYQIWQLLGHILQSCVNAHLRKYEVLAKSIQRSLDVGRSIKNKKLIKFLEKCNQYNMEAMKYLEKVKKQNTNLIY